MGHKGHIGIADGSLFEETSHARAIPGKEQTRLETSKRNIEKYLLRKEVQGQTSYQLWRISYPFSGVGGFLSSPNRERGYQDSRP
jgi:hypothetical protein